MTTPGSCSSVTRSSRASAAAHCASCSTCSVATRRSNTCAPANLAVPWWTGRNWQKARFAPPKNQISTRELLIIREVERDLPNRANRELIRSTREPIPTITEGRGMEPPEPVRLARRSVLITNNGQQRCDADPRRHAVGGRACRRRCRGDGEPYERSNARARHDLHIDGNGRTRTAGEVFLAAGAVAAQLFR